MSDRPAHRVLTTITSLDWAMTQEYLDLFCAIALRENEPVAAVERRLGRKLDNSHDVTVRDGIATIPIIGPIFRYADIFTAISGGTTVASLAQDIDMALADPAIRGIVLSIDSPGGEINGIHETAAMIAAARTVKPITAYIGHLGASAAYWLATAADRIVIDATAAIGSIGVVTAVRDPAKVNSRDITFVSSQSPRKRPDPSSERGRDEIQSRLDALADVFIAAVAAHRGTTSDDVIEHYGQGGLLIGQEAITVGMADALGSYEGVLAEMAAATNKQEVFLMSKPAEQAAAAIATPEHDARDDELAALKAQIATERTARVRAEAATFVETAIREHRMLPGERDAAVALYTVLAQDDAAHPRDGESRITLLTTALKARPQHTHTQEMVSVQGGDLAVAHNRTETPRTDDQRDVVEEASAHARAYAQRRNGVQGGA